MASDLKRPGQQASVCNPENREMVRQAVIRSPRKSASRHASELRMSDRSVRRLLKTLHFHPYKLSLVQDLNVIDKQSRLAFARSFLELKEQNPGICDWLFMSDEAPTC
ncbi:hypothetical protein C0J52_11333 [Blattella germanica]|nr:hypothetical protein C0J52_11333 [Blattella germanica]